MDVDHAPANISPAGPWLTVPEAARHLGISRSGTYTLLRQGMPSSLLGRCRRIHRDDLDAWVRAQKSP
jgi:excisionase family DNA binding protein